MDDMLKAPTCSICRAVEAWN